MIINLLLSKIQKILEPFYINSIVLRNIDKVLLPTFILIIILSSFVSSDTIGCLVIVAITLTLVKLIAKPNERIFLSFSEKVLLAYLMTVIISVAGSSLLMLSIKGFCKTLIYIGFYASLITYLKDNKSKIKYILLSIIAVTFFESLVALKQNFLSVAEISGWQDMSRLNPEEVMTRVYGTLKPLNPNLFGGYLLAALPANLMLIYFPLINKHYKTAITGLVLFGLTILAIIMTGCRGAYIGLFFELILLAILTYRYLKPYYKKLFLLFSGFISGITALIIVSLPALRARVFSIFAMRSDSSNSFRFNVYNSCIEMFKDNWLLGIGVGNQNFREIYGLYMRTGFDALSAYNIYLETAVESGIFALLAFLAFVLINLYKAIRYILNSKKKECIYLIIALVSLSGMLIHGIVDTVFFRPQIQIIFWTMVAIIRVITTNNKGVSYGRS